jgi:peptidoglycan hydrolase-like protein with peptidoglycan-binding domain
MDYQNGKYGYPPSDEDPNSAGQDPNAPRPYPDDPAAYGATPLNYGQDAGAYGSAYGQDPNVYGSAGSYENDYSARQPGADYGSQDPSYSQQAGYGAGNEYAPLNSGAYGAQEDYSQPPANDGYSSRQTGRYYTDPDSAYATRRASAGESGYVPRGNTSRTSMPGSDEGYGYSARGNTARTSMPRGDEEYGYSARGNTSRTAVPRDDGYSQRGNTSRTRYPQEMREDDVDDFYDREPRAPRSGKKKRSKFGKFMHALGLYLAQMPAKTLVIFGGTFAMALVAVILLAVLLPNSQRTERADDGQLALTDLTPTPSIAPTNTPAPTEAVTPTPELPTLTENIANAGTVSDLIPDIQKRLVELGYMDEPEGGYTNKYGPTTKTAIRLFQMKNFDSSDDWDGIIGNGTYSLLMSDQAKAYYLSRGDGDDRTKVITKLVQDVTSLQNRLIELGYLTPGSATGLYGATTVEAVQKFQEYHGLSPIDGKAGQETLNLIYSTDAMDATTGKANNKSKMSPTPSVSPDAAGTTTTTTAQPAVTTAQ